MRSWKEAAARLSLDEHRSIEEVRTPAKRGGSVQFEGGGPGSFKDDMERWEWETVQWKCHKDKDRAWLDANGDRIFGPPIYPGAHVVERNSFLKAVEEAHEAGFITGRELWTVVFDRRRPLPMHLECIRKLATRLPHLVRCTIRLPYLEVEGITQHVRCFDADELKLAYLESPEAPALRARYMEAYNRRWKIKAEERARVCRAKWWKKKRREKKRAEKAARAAERAERRRLREEERARQEQQR